MTKEDNKMIIDRINEKLNQKLTEKKQYEVVIRKEALFNIGIVTAMNMLAEENRELLAVYKDCAELVMFMDIEQKTAIELALRDYLVSMRCLEVKPEVKTMVWK